jgi:hypothetical protein
MFLDGVTLATNFVQTVRPKNLNQGPLTHSHSHSHTHTHTLTLTHTHALTLTHARARAHAHTHTHRACLRHKVIFSLGKGRRVKTEGQLLLWQYHKHISSYINLFLATIQHPSAIWHSSRSRLYTNALRGDHARLPVRLRPNISNHKLYRIFVKFSIKVQG